MELFSLLGVALVNPFPCLAGVLGPGFFISLLAKIKNQVLQETRNWLFQMDAKPTARLTARLEVPVPPRRLWTAIRRTSLVIGAGLFGAPQKNRETCNQLGWFKRLGEMVVCTGFEGLQFILQG